MKTTNNEIKIIQILLASNDYISTYEIATLMVYQEDQYERKLITSKTF